ncbi:hypothetical protein DSO57_1036552 [Entomophthora muscae]|uniref:Uncharacterized protein n=1 Tax=Entomophthora muscae TaxID=34485 RepID=A0ACC2SP32_9FUNG|nr:hypothetical protein DSO57_1036552 [Entomophthora muscae]
MQVRRTEGGGGSKHGYQDVLVTLTTCEGHKIEAQSLMSAPTRPGCSETRPSLRYLTLLRRGAVEHTLSSEYIDYLNRLPHYTTETIALPLARLNIMAALSPILIPSLPTLALCYAL